ncbi:unnamed protein product [Allacma fusca]|uniref:Uncharacterized protein n=1 Tax=Allacma fusca TaxID=39272 RepID=A0A8J2JCI2_9HEXA|nr:unnamed protein product [Allacma fusca]
MPSGNFIKISGESLKQLNKKLLVELAPCIQTDPFYRNHPQNRVNAEVQLHYSYSDGGSGGGMLNGKEESQVDVYLIVTSSPSVSA